MTQARTLQVIAALSVIAMAATAAILAGTSAVATAIGAAVGLGIIFVMWDRDTHVAPPPASAPTQVADEQDAPGQDAFRRVVEGLSEPVLVIQRGKVALANARALNLFGSHVIGEDARIAIRHPAAAERLSSTQPLSHPIRIDMVGLGTRSQHWSMQIIPMDENTGRQRLFVYLSDITGLRSADRVRGDFVANASHELRTPLAAILGFIETLQDPETGGDEATRHRFLSIVESEARRMQQLIDDLISLSRIEAEKHRLPATLVSLAALIEETVALCRQNLGDRGADIVTRIDDDVPAVRGERTQIAQLLHNLIGNAAKYSRAGTPIVVGLHHGPSGMIRIEVGDEGEGIPPEHLPRLTERFYRVDSGRSRAMGGTGLGLAIVKHIVERHRGRLDISSTIGKGTVVTVLLPQADEPISNPAIKDASSTALS